MDTGITPTQPLMITMTTPCGGLRLMICQKYTKSHPSLNLQTKPTTDPPQTSALAHRTTSGILSPRIISTLLG